MLISLIIYERTTFSSSDVVYYATSMSNNSSLYGRYLDPAVPLIKTRRCSERICNCCGRSRVNINQDRCRADNHEPGPWYRRTWEAR